MSATRVAVPPPDEIWEGTEEGVDALLDEWHVAEGDVVAEGDLLASVTVVKTSFSVAAPVAGRIAEILVARGDTFSRDEPLAAIDVDGG